MMKNKQDWELALLDMWDNNQIYTSVRIIADGYNVSFNMQLNSKKKYCIFYYIDGVWKGIYTLKDNEIGQKFGVPLRLKVNKAMLGFYKKHRKKEVAKYLEDSTAIYAYNAFHNSANSLIKLLKQNCKDIKLVRYGESND